VNHGERVLDAACGFGDTAVLLADRVGPEGFVLGVDRVEGFVHQARQAAGDRPNLRFETVDVERADFDPEFDLVFSRFGTMFFTNLVIGLRRHAAALKPGGRLAIIVWRDRDDNPAWDNAKHVLLRHLPPPGEDADTCGPGPFSQADPDVLTSQLKAAGFEDIELQRIDATVTMGRDVDDAIAFQFALGPAGEIYREAGDEATRKHDQLVEALTEMYKPYGTPQGVRMPSSSWLATARKP